MTLKKLVYIISIILFLLLAILIFININVGVIGDKTVIEYAYWVGVPEEIEANRLIIDAFHRENKDVKVIVRHHPWSDYFTKLYTGIITKTAPDVFRMSYAFLPDYVHYKAIESFDRFISKDTTFSIENMVKWPFEACTIDNQIMMLPLDCHVDILFYNKDIFDKANVPYPNEKWTWDDLLKYGLKLKDFYRKKGVEDFYPLAGVSYSQFIMENGGKILDREKLVCTLNTPAAIEGLKFLRDLIHKYEIALTPDAENAIVGGNPFLKEKCAMTYGGAYMIQTYLSKATFKWDITYRPKGKVWLAKNLSCGLCMNPKSQKKEAAWRLIKFFVSPTAQKIYAEVGAFVPILKSVLYSNVFLPEDTKPEHKYLLLDVEDSHSQNWICRNWGRFRTAIGQIMDLVMEDKISPEEACRRAEIKGNQILDEVYGRKK